MVLKLKTGLVLKEKKMNKQVKKKEILGLT